MIDMGGGETPTRHHLFFEKPREAHSLSLSSPPKNVSWEAP